MFIWRSSKLAFAALKLLTHKVKGCGPRDLSGLVIRSLNSVISRNERLGWGQKRLTKETEGRKFGMLETQGCFKQNPVAFNRAKF